MNYLKWDLAADTTTVPDWSGSQAAWRDNIIPVILFGNNWIQSNLIPTQIEESRKPNPPRQGCCTPECYYDKMTTRKSLFVKAKDRGRQMPVAEENALARSDVVQQRDRAPAPGADEWGQQLWTREISVIALMNTRADLSAPRRERSSQDGDVFGYTETNSFSL